MKSAMKSTEMPSPCPMLHSLWQKLMSPVSATMLGQKPCEMHRSRKKSKTQKSLPSMMMGSFRS